MQSVVVFYLMCSPYNTNKENVFYIWLRLFLYAKTFFYVMMLQNNLMLVYIEANMTIEEVRKTNLSYVGNKICYWGISFCK